MLEPKDKVFITRGKYAGEKGIIECPSTSTPGEYLIKITTLIPPQITFLNPDQFCKVFVLLKQKHQ